MALYSMKDVQSKGNSRPEFRKLEVEAGGKPKKLWIPEFKFDYKRIHYSIQKYTKYTHSKYGTMDCFNSNYGEKGSGCPICESVESLWKQYREEKSKDKKTEIYGLISKILTEEYWLNVVDLSDPDRKFVAARFTPSKWREIKDVNETQIRKGSDISGVVFLFSKTIENKITKYSIIADDDQKDLTAKLQDQYEALSSREYDDGGPIDLERCISKNSRGREEYLSILMNESGDEYPEHHEETSHKDSPKDEPKKETKPKAEPPKKEKPVKVDEDTMSLDDVGLQEDELGLSLDDDPKKAEVKMVVLTAQKIKDDQKNEAFLLPIYDHLSKAKMVSSCTTYVEKVKAVFAFVKEKKEYSIPETELKAKDSDDLDLNLD